MLKLMLSGRTSGDGCHCHKEKSFSRPAELGEPDDSQILRGFPFVSCFLRNGFSRMAAAGAASLGLGTKPDCVFFQRSGG